MRLSGILWVTLIFLPLAAHADPAQNEARARQLFTEVRCVQCQSESIADSDAQIAGDMRREIRDDIQAGKSNAEIRQSLFDHYGDYVLFRPRLTKSNLVLWALPFLIILLGCIWFVVVSKKSSKSNNYTLNVDDVKKLQEILKTRH